MHEDERLMSIARGVITSNISVIEDEEYRKIDCQQRDASFDIAETRDLWVWTGLPVVIIESDFKTETLHVPTNGFEQKRRRV